MWTPWKNKTGLSKAMGTLATVASIATVSCGVNWAILIAWSASPNSEAFATAGVIEAVALFISVAGLILLPIIRWLSKTFTTPNPPENKDQS